MIDSTDAQLIVREGQAAATAGDMMAARERFRRATEIDPGNVEAWLGLSAAVPILSEKKQYLQKVLALQPHNPEALDSLAYVNKLIADGLQIAPSRRRELRNESGDASPLLSSPAADAPAVEVLHCYRHPTRETGLRCTNCNRPICSECAKTAAVGQLCPECRKERRPSNYKVSAREAIIGFVVALFTSFLVSLLLLLLPPFGLLSFFLVIIVGPAIAEFIVRVVDRVTRSKRGRAMQGTIGTAVVLGNLPALGSAIFVFGNPLFIFIYLVLCVSMVTARLR